MQRQQALLRERGGMMLRSLALAVLIVAHGATVASADWPWTKHKASFPDARRVAKIEVAVFGFPSGTVERELSIDKKGQIAKAMAILEKCREGWKRQSGTKANGDVVVNFCSFDSKAVWPLCQVRMGKGWISTDINGQCHARAISVTDQNELLDVLGVDSSVLEHKSDGTGKRAMK